MNSSSTTVKYTFLTECKWMALEIVGAWKTILGTILCAAIAIGLFVGMLVAIEQVQKEQQQKEQARQTRVAAAQKAFQDAGLFGELPLTYYREFKQSYPHRTQEEAVLGTGALREWTTYEDLVDFDTEIGGILMDTRNVPLYRIERQAVNDDQPETIQFVFTDQWLGQVETGPQNRLDQYIRLFDEERHKSNIAKVIVKVRRSKLAQLFQP